MSVYCPAGGADYLERSTEVLPNTDSTYMGWVKERTIATDPAYNTVFIIHDYSYVTWAAVYTSVFATTLDVVGPFAPFPTSPTANKWTHYCWQQEGTTQRLYRDFVLVSTGTRDRSTYAASYDQVGGDGFSAGDLDVAFVRQWSAVLSLAEICLEAVSRTAVRTANLWLDTPLETDLLDVSGNGRDWTAVGAPTFSATPLAVYQAEALTLAESLKIYRTPLVVRKSESINLDDAIYKIVTPVALGISLFETITVKDQRPVLASPTLVISLAETITVTEGPLNNGASGNAAVIGPAPPPIAIPADYWEVGV